MRLEACIEAAGYALRNTQKLPSLSKYSTGTFYLVINKLNDVMTCQNEQCSSF